MELEEHGPEDEQPSKCTQSSGSQSERWPSVLSREIYLLVLKYLSDEGFEEVRGALMDALTRHSLLPQRLAWDGTEHAMDWLHLVMCSGAGCDFYSLFLLPGE